jgi:excisionase family DNA binding protein
MNTKKIKKSFDVLFDEISGLKKTISEFIDKQNISKAPEPPIFIDHVCEITNLKKSTIYVLVFQKKIPFVKPEGTKKLQFSRSAIIQWLNSGRQMVVKN